MQCIFMRYKYAVMKPIGYSTSVAILIFSCISMSAISSFSQEIPETDIHKPVLTDSSFNLYDTGTILLSGQPNQKNLEDIKDQGVTLVINIRTAAEIREHDMMLFNEKQYIEGLGMAYLNAEVGGKAGFHPEVIREIADAIFSTEGRVLIHCGSAARATLVWMAWLVRFQDYKIDEAIRLGKLARFTFPFEELLGYTITMKKGK